MNISTNLANSPAQVYRGKPAASQSEASPAANDSVTLSSNRDADDIKNILTWGAMGAVPALGAVTNLMAAAVTTITRNETAAAAAAGGIFANVLGTGALVTGLIIGSNATTFVGAGLLVGAGVAGGYAAAQA